METKESILKKMEGEKDLYELEINGFDCIINRNMGHFNGYVDITYQSLDIDELEVHGGITYQGPAEDLGIEGLTKTYGMVIGFDTAHYGDAFIYPNWSNDDFVSLFMDGEYKDYEYVKSELESLTLQLTK